jgi:hypothetical protein
MSTGRLRDGKVERSYDVQLSIRYFYNTISCGYLYVHANTVVVEMRRTVSVTLATVTVTVPPTALKPLGVMGTMAIGPGA